MIAQAKNTISPGVVSLLAALLLSRPADADSPSLVRITPRGGERGTELDVTLSGARLKDAQSIFFYRTGIEALAVEPVNDGSVKVRLKISPDAPLGEHPLRLRTATGITELRTFFVGPFPTVNEKEPNNDFNHAQKIDLNSTAAGVIENEDVDFYRVEARKGQRITAEVEGIRLGVTPFDPYLSISDMKGSVLAVSDDSSLLLQDPVTSILAPEDGAYVIQVRESTYGGSADCFYRLHVGTFPRPMVVYPAGGKVGEELTLTYIGDARGPITQKVTLPLKPNDQLAVYAEDDGQTPPSPNYVRVSEFPNIMEVEPNNHRDQATATDLPLPVALNGIIDPQGDEDWFRFKAKKGQSFDVRVYARALRSPLDAVLDIYQAGGNLLASNDDQGGPDPGIRFTAPVDGEYELRVRDLLGNGGPACVYRVEFNAIRPSVYTHIPAYDNEPNGQTRQWVVVPRGNRFATWIRVERSNCDGDMNLSFEDLPAGMVAHAGTIASNVDRTPVVFEAAQDAELAGRLADVIAIHADPKQNISGRFRQNVNLVFGAPNNTVYYGTHVNKLAAAVAEQAPFKIDIVEPKVPLVRGGSMNLKVVAERKEGFGKPITLKMLWTPPGIGAQGSVTIPEGKSEADYPINADGGAPTRPWKIAILGSADGSYGTTWVSSQLIDLSVATPYVGMKIDMANVEQGQSTDILCRLDQQKPFEGKAKVILRGLPAQVAVDPPEREITKDDKEVIFNVKADPKSPAGQHKSLFCQVIVIENGEPISHGVGSGGVLRIDPPKKDNPPLLKPKEVAGKSEPGEPVKRLTPLEKLRREAQERNEETKGGAK